MAGQGLTGNESRASSQNSGEEEAVCLGLNSVLLKQHTFEGERR